MNAAELAQKIQLHPRAAVLVGTIETRMKNRNTLEGFTPHYAKEGCPIVQYAGANAVSEPSAAEVEFAFQEAGFPLPAALLGYSPKQGNLVQLMFGRNGQAPTQGAYRVLREASSAIKQLSGGKREVFLVSLPILTPGKMGVVTGRHYFLGLFDTLGVPLYLNPDAVGSVFKAEFPQGQKERFTAPELAAGAPGAAGWYETMAAALATTGLKGHKLHEQIVKARAAQLVDQGAAPNLDAGLAKARSDAPKPPSEEAKAEGRARELGARMRGRRK